jgi:hypothetical protein
MLKKIIFWGSLIFFASTELIIATPSINIISGELIHNGTINITGTQFGSKTPAAPLLWDNGTSIHPLSNYYDAWLPTDAQQGAHYNMSYRSVPFRGVNAPNNRISFILGGAHAEEAGAGAYASGHNVGVGKNITSHKYFINYWYRIDPLYDEKDYSGGDNMKEIVLTNTEGSFYPEGFGAFGYTSWCGTNAPDVNQTEPIIISRMPINPANQDLPYGCSGRNLIYHNNPINGWIKMQWEGSYNQEYDGPQITLTTYPDGKVTNTSHYGDGLTVHEYYRGPWANYPKENDLRFIGLGGFARVPRLNNGTNSFRYFAGIYMDNTHARVMIGDDQNYDSCTVMEPQPPLAWSNSTIAVKFNQGSLSDGTTVYLFVFDSNNNHNVNGYPVEIKSMTYYPLLVPQNLRVID